MIASPFGPQKDLFFMKKALRLAYRAVNADEVPVGAIIVDSQGLIIGRGYNQVEKFRSQNFHAEMIALAKAGKKTGDWRLEGCWIYVTLEPCAMCMHAIALARCAGLVYGASSPHFGYQVIDNNTHFQLYKENVLDVVAGLCALESAEVLKSFFKAQRAKKKEEL